MDWVRQVWLLLVQEYRQQRVAIAVVGALIAAAVVTDIYDPWGFERRDATVAAVFEGGVSEWITSGFLPLAAILIVGLSVQKDLAGADTRSESVADPAVDILFTARSAFLILLFGLAPALANALVLAYYGEEASDLAFGIGRNVCLATVELAWLSALAAITATFLRFLLVLVVAGVIWSASSSFVFLTFPAGLLELRTTMLVSWFISALVMWRQYHRRNYRTTLVVVTAGLTLGPFTYLAPWPSLPGAKRVDIKVDSAGVDNELRPVPFFWLGLHILEADRSRLYEPRKLSGILNLRKGQDVSVRWQAHKYDTLGFDAREALRAEFPGWQGLASENWGGGTDIVDARIYLDPAPREMDWTDFRGSARFDEYAYQRVGGVALARGARLAGEATRIEVMTMDRVDETILLDLRSSRIVEADRDPLTVGVLLIHEGHKLVVLPNQLVEDIAGNQPGRIRERMGRVIVQSRQRFAFQLPDDATQYANDSFQIQLWVPMRVGRAVAEIKVQNNDYAP
ncbi:MAG: hypothetical protein H6509_08935 [Bryobacterales bacterium]|nr:hypothetical protein [Bryobacterales bacterium]